MRVLRTHISQSSIRHPCECESSFSSEWSEWIKIRQTLFRVSSWLCNLGQVMGSLCALDPVSMRRGSWWFILDWDGDEEEPDASRSRYAIHTAIFFFFLLCTWILKARSLNTRQTSSEVGMMSDLFMFPPGAGTPRSCRSYLWNERLHLVGWDCRLWWSRGGGPQGGTQPACRGSAPGGEERGLRLDRDRVTPGSAAGLLCSLSGSSLVKWSY